MPYRWKRSESATDALRRLIQERLSRALASLRLSSRAEAIHAARKEIKKARAVLSLFGRHASRRSRREVNERLRTASRELAPLRDAYNQVQSLSALIKSSAPARPPLRRVRTRLRARLAAQERAFGESRTIQKVASALRQAIKTSARMKVSGSDQHVLDTSLARTYRRGRRTFASVQTDATPEKLHTWRKRVKELRCQLALVRRMAPELRHGWLVELDELGATLGEDHDLTVLEAATCAAYGAEAPEHLLVHQEARARQRELRTRAFLLGARLYAEKPSSFQRRFKTYWHIWRDERKTLRKRARQST